MHAAMPSEAWRSMAEGLVERAGVPDLAVILGSGLGDVALCAEPILTVPYADIEGFPPVSVSGHAGHLLVGHLQGWNVWFFRGRLHRYEGYSAERVTVPVQLAAAAGASRLLLTNAAGAILPDWPVGSFMWVEDHLNLTGDNPLRGLGGDTFVDLSRLYRNDLFSAVQLALGPERPILNRGILAGLTGPSYETPAEIRALRHLGASAVSMSMVLEAIMACYLKMEVVGLSFLSNPAAGVSDERLNHADVLAAGKKGAARLTEILSCLVDVWQTPVNPS